MRVRPLRAAFAALATAGLVAATIGLTPIAAAAANTGSFTVATAQEYMVGGSGGPGKVYPTDFTATGQITSVTVTYDFTKLAGVATPSFPDPTSDCAIAGSIGTCTLPDVDSSTAISITIPVKFTPVDGVAENAKGSFVVSISGTGADTASGGDTVLIGDGADLVVLDRAQTVKAKPGDDVAFKYAFGNAGNKVADGIVVVFTVTHGFIPDTFDNCEYVPQAYGQAVVCRLDQSVAPGDAYTLDLTGKLADSAASNEYGGSEVLASSVSDVAESLLKAAVSRPHTGRDLTVKAAASGSRELDELDNFAFLDISVATSHDAVVGDYSLKGDVGDSSTAYLIMKNDGPASLNFDGTEPISSILVTVPEFATVTTAPGTCDGVTDPTKLTGGAEGKPGYPYYVCTSDAEYLAAGDLLRYAFTFKITKDHGANGSYTILPHTAAADGDSDLSNNTAKIFLIPGDGDGSLPVTGSRTSLIAGAGGALVLLGGVLLILGRRRKRAAAV